MKDEPEVVAVFDEETGKMKYLPKQDLKQEAALRLLFDDGIIPEMSFSGVDPELDNSVAEYTALSVDLSEAKVYRNVVYVKIFDVWFMLGQLERVYDYDVLEVLKK